MVPFLEGGLTRFLDFLICIIADPLVVNVMMGSVIITHRHSDDGQCDNGSVCSSHGRNDDVSETILETTATDTPLPRFGRFDDHNGSDHIIGSHISHSDDGPGDDHNCDGIYADDKKCDEGQ